MKLDLQGIRIHLLFLLLTFSLCIYLKQKQTKSERILLTKFRGFAYVNDNLILLQANF